MLCRLSHLTRYDFDRAVFLEPHVVRLLPRPDACQRVVSLAVDIDPTPAGQTACLDLSGNAVRTVWFSGLTSHLEIRVAATVETLRVNPFDYLIENGKSRLPVLVSPTEAALVGPYLAQTPLSHGRAAALADDLRAGGADTPQTFAMALAAWMAANLCPTTREEPGLLSPDAVLGGSCGACRDLSVCYMAACRHVGLPARFVSGYHEGDPARDDAELHAWVEVWLPGGGWRGFDPSLGLAVADRHVAVAAAADPADAAPVEGTYRGEPVVSRLSHSVRLELS